MSIIKYIYTYRRNAIYQHNRSCVKVEVADLVSPSLIVLMVSMDVASLNVNCGDCQSTASQLECTLQAGGETLARELPLCAMQ